MATTTEQLKASLREQLRARTAAMSSDTRAAASAQLRAQLEHQDFFQNASAILFFAPLPDEPDIWPLLEPTLAKGVTVALPRFVLATQTYEAAVITDLAHDLVSGKFGVREPAATCPVLAWNRLDLALVPGLGFTVEGNRLGRGRGFYDRLLPLVGGITCGLAFDWQMVDSIPVAPHDITLNRILTPSRRMP